MACIHQYTHESDWLNHTLPIGRTMLSNLLMTSNALLNNKLKTDDNVEWEKL